MHSIVTSHAKKPSFERGSLKRAYSPPPLKKGDLEGFILNNIP